MDSIRDLQMIDLEILKEVIRICEKIKTKYYVIGGTFLGAVRHKGFIPWDDDIDIAMPREDYEKFLEAANTELNSKYKVLNYRTDPDFHYCITRLVDTTKEVIEKRDRTKKSFVAIDIFPIDGTPNNKILRKLYYFNIMKHRAILSLCYKENIDKERKRKKSEKILIAILTKIPFNKIFSARKEKIIIDKKLSKQDIKKSNNIGTIMGAYRTREIVPKEYFGKGAYYDFEDIKVMGPEMYDEYLTHMYGDYMTIPKNVDRKTHYEIVKVKGE